MLTDRSRNASRIGEIVEHKAIIWLAQQGYEVFRNFSRVGPVDIVVMDSLGNLVPVDVKKVVDGDRRSTRVFKPELTEEQVALKVRLLYYNEKHDFFGWHMDDIYASLERTPREQVAKTVIEVIDGIEVVRTLGEIAKQYGIKPDTLRSRRNRLPNEPIADAIAHLKNATRRIVVFGVEYSDRRELCRAFDINPASLEYRTRDLGETLEQAVTHFRRKHAVQNQDN